MKTINCIDCEVIKDLLPSYADKISSEASNKLVEEHLKKCKNCTNTLKNMNKEVDNEMIENQEEQIDYLKGFKRKKITTIICVIIITILICVNLFLITSKILMDVRFIIDLDELDIDGWIGEDRKGENWEEQNRITFDLCCEKYQVFYDVIRDEQKGEVHIKVFGKYAFPGERGNMVCVIDKEDTNKIYIENEKGEIKKVWDIKEGFLVEDISNRVRESNRKWEEMNNSILKSLYEKNK